MEQKLNSNSSAGTAADSDTLPIAHSSTDIAVNPMLAAGWISVKENLPEAGQIVLVVFDIGSSDWYKYPTNMQLARFHVVSQYEKWFQDKSSLHPIASEKITHWHSIPNDPSACR